MRSPLRPLRPSADQYRAPRIERAALVVLLVACLVCAALVLQRRAQTPAFQIDGINVLVISLDTTRRDHLSCYGYERETTPHLDALAAEGLLFGRCAAVSNWTLPTHASMLSGLYPSTHGAHYQASATPVTREGHPTLNRSGAMSSSCRTLAEVLRGAGHRTGAIVSNTLYLQRAYQLDQGFDHYDDRCGCPLCRQSGNSSSDPPVPYRRASEIVDESIRWLTSDRSKPFFLFLNFLDPHDPYFPPAPYSDRFRNAAAKRAERSVPKPRKWWVEMNWWRSYRDRILSDRSSLPPEVEAWFRSQYDGEIAYLDDQLGRLFAWLRRADLYDQTLVIVTSDHGECFGEHGLMEHGFGVYEQELAVPMIVKLPRSQRRGERIDYRVSHVDVMPTVLDVLGLPVPQEVQGTTMLAFTPRRLFAEVAVCEENAKLFPAFNRRMSVVYDGSRKLIAYSDGTGELYDLEADPDELHDLSTTDPEAAGNLQAAMQLWQKHNVPISEAESGSVPLQPHTAEQLRDLGYAQ